MATLAGFSHVSLSVRDLERSVTFYREVFGFDEFERLGNDVYRECVMVHPSTGMVLCLQRHAANGGEGFSPERTGLDHVAFRVLQRADLDAWESRLRERGVTFTPVVEEHYGAVLCCRDPDGIQLEVFHREGHPGA